MIFSRINIEHLLDKWGEDIRRLQAIGGTGHGIMSDENRKAIREWQQKEKPMKKKTTKKIYRSAIDGKLVTKAKAKRNPDTTVTETVQPVRVGDLIATLGLAPSARELTPGELGLARALVAELNPAGPIKVSRSARSGEFVTRANAKRNPSTTTTERVRRPKRK